MSTLGKDRNTKDAVSAVIVDKYPVHMVDIAYPAVSNRGIIPFSFGGLWNVPSMVDISYYVPSTYAAARGGKGNQEAWKSYKASNPVSTTTLASLPTISTIPATITTNVANSTTTTVTNPTTFTTTTSSSTPITKTSLLTRPTPALTSSRLPSSSLNSMGFRRVARASTQTNPVQLLLTKSSSSSSSSEDTSTPIIVASPTAVVEHAIECKIYVQKGSLVGLEQTTLDELNGSRWPKGVHFSFLSENEVAKVVCYVFETTEDDPTDQIEDLSPEFEKIRESSSTFQLFYLSSSSFDILVCSQRRTFVNFGGHKSWNT